MSICAIFLFGSRARGDNTPDSDTDLLITTSEGDLRHITRANLSMSFYPLEELTKRAREGDLFICHVVNEAKPIYDPEGQLDLLRSNFRLRVSYTRNIQHALQLGWFLVLYADQLRNKALVKRRLAWCVRTILIARSAEQGTPVFSAHELAKRAGSSEVMHLITQKDSKVLAPGIVGDFCAFLCAQGMREPPATSREEFASLFAKSRNDIALSTSKLIDSGSEAPLYS
jgi:hypothetical protein